MAVSPLVLIVGQNTKNIEKIYRFQPWANVTYIRNVRGSSAAVRLGASRSVQEVRRRYSILPLPLSVSR